MRFRLLLVVLGAFLVSSAGATIIYVSPGSSIQAAISSASPGDEIQVAAGTYTENILVDRRVAIVGAGSGSDPLSNTIITQTAAGAGDSKVGVVQLAASGLSVTEPILLQNLRLAPVGLAGISVGRFTEATGTVVAFVELDNVKVVGTNATPATEQERGLYADLTSTLSNLAVSGCAFDNLSYGWYIQKQVSADASTVSDVTVTGTTFNHNNLKGIYAEKLTRATFTGCEASDNGFSDAGVPSYFLPWMCGIDVNLKAGTYSDLQFIDCTVTNNGLGGAKEGTGLALKGRGTGLDSSYYSFPATLDDVIIDGCMITGNERGVRLGEPGKLNTTPTNVVVTGCELRGNVQTYGGSDGSAYGDLVMQSTAPCTAGGNWWGDLDPSDQIGIAPGAGGVTYSPWLNAPPGTVPMTWSVAPPGTIQAAINAADPGDTIEVAAGLYTERLVVDRPLTLLGATRAVNKNGYTVPSGYAWNPNVETIVNYPDPTGLAEGLSQVVDIVADDVTFKGFVVQLLNARCDFNGDNLLRVNAGLPGSPGQTRHNVVVENNVLGPTTNVSSQTGTCGRMGLYLASPSYATQLQGITNSFFRGNKIIDVRGNGDNVFIWGSAESYFSLQDADYTGTVIEDNEITGSHRSGIEIAGGVNGLTIRDNVIANCSSTNGGSADPNLKYGSGIVVIRMGGDKTSPTARGAHHLTITGNVIRDNEKNGIYLGPFNTDHTIADNIITGNDATGLRVDLTEAYYGGTWPVLGVTANIDAGDNIIAGNLAGAAVTGVPSNGFRLDALGCWWGSASGPLHPTLNPTGTGNSVSDYIDFNPWLTGIIVTDPDPLDLTVVPNNQGDIVVSYLGGMGGIYGYSIDVVWNNAIAAAVPADFTRPATGPFATAQLFQVVNLGAGHVRVDAGLGGNQPGIPAGPLFKAHFTAAGGQGTQTPVDLTVAYIMDYASPPVINVPADDGLIRVDTVAPVVTDVLVTNISTGSTIWLRNGQNISVTATVTDGAPLTVTCDLEDFGGGAAVAPDGLPVGDVYTWTLNNVTCNPADGPVTATVTATDALANVSTGSDAITADNTLPDPLQNLLARPGHQKVHLSWGDASGNDDNYAGVELRYVVRTNYPQYDDVAVPAYPANHNEGTLALQATGTAVDWTIVPRDIYYLAGFVYDLAGNYSVTPGSPTNQDAATNYWLGDVRPDGSWDGFVNISDVTALGDSYGLDEGMVGFNAQCDVGPTDDWSPTGLPLPDDVIGFFDLMVFAMNFGEVLPTLEFTPGALPALAWRQLDETSWVLALTGECAGLKGLNLSAELPEGVSCQVQPGALLSRQDAPVFMRNIPQHGLDAGLAVLGQGVGIAGAGELMVVTFSEPVTGLEIEVLARDLNNDELLAEMAGTTGVEIPIVASLAQNYPNPFNPQTTIEFGLPRSEQVRISVYSVNGARIRTLIDEARPAGVHRVIWDGRDEAGRCAATGAYFYKIDAGDFHQVRKMILVK